jgi:Ca-activated chloride channel family protein
MIDANLTFGAGRLKVKASDRDGGATLDRVTIRVTEDDADSPDGRREVARSTATEPEFTLSAGTYYISARQGQAEVRERVLVNAGDDVARTLILAQGRLSLQSRLAGASTPIDNNIAYRIERIDRPQEVVNVRTATARVDLPAGRYRVESRLGGQNARISREIDIRAGAPASMAFEHLAASVQLKLATILSAGSGDVLWNIRDAQDRSIWQSMQAQPRAYLSAGRYKIIAESRDRRGRAEIEVKSGDTRVIEVQLE